MTMTIESPVIMAKQTIEKKAMLENQPTENLIDLLIEHCKTMGESKNNRLSHCYEIDAVNVAAIRAILIERTTKNQGGIPYLTD